MQIDVGSHIADLLYQYNSVNIPGLGGFVSRYKAAAADQVQGEIHPPAKGLNFNGNLVADDGLLAQHLHEKLGITLAEAQQAVDEYVKQVKEAIDKREIVVFPRVGRLYKDYEQNLQFLADTTNFNLDSYGLPTVRFYPIARSAVQGSSVRPAAGQPQAAVAAAPPLEKNIIRKNGLVIAISIALAVVIVASYFLFFHNPAGGDENARRLPTSRVNVSPSSPSPSPPQSPQGGEEEPYARLPEGDEGAMGEDPYTGEDSDSPEDDLDTEGATPAPGQKYFIIGIGVFGDDNNVQRLIERIYKAGYEPYTEPKGNLTRVGIQKAYTDDSEIQEALRDVRKRFSKDAKVLKK